MKKLRPYIPMIVIAIAAVLLASNYVTATLHHNAEFGMPLEDAYIYLTYAKQFGRAEPFTYFPGGEYSAGSTSVLWPMLIAPFWTLGARGHALVWVSFGLCTLLFAASLVMCYRLVREMFGEVAGCVAAALAIAVAPFVWCSLSGMEVAFAAFLLVLSIFLLAKTPREGPPSKLLVAVLAATSLSRPESTVIVAGIVGVAVINRLRQRDLRSAAWWLTPLAPPLLWVIANKLFAGNFFPNTGVAKSHFYLPGFDWTYWWDAVTAQTERMLKIFFFDATSPFVWPRVIGVLWLVGAARIMWWARREKRWLVGFLVIASPFALLIGVVASSGAWWFHNYRYVAAAFPLIMVTAACALAPAKLPRLPEKPVRIVWAIAAALFVGVFWRAARAPMREDILLYAQNVADLNRQVVTLGRYIRDKLPDDSYIMFHDAGAIAYYGDKPVYDMLGLVTNRQAHVANNGPGSRFEFLESLPPERRPTHFAYYPGWMGQHEFFGEVLVRTPIGRAISKRRLIGDGDMQLIRATWERAHTAERPLEPIAGWHIVDRVDVADMVSERAHDWNGALGRRRFGDPTARWSLTFKESGSRGLLIDGGRTIRAGRESFTIATEPGKPIKLLMRTGGVAAQAWHDTISKPVKATISTSAGKVEITIPVPTNQFVEIPIDLPPVSASRTTVTMSSQGPYRVYHWIALQPD